MSFPKPSANYWTDKLIAYMHDPFDKVFHIPGHEERAAKILAIFGEQKPNEAFWRKADGMAAGFDRGQVPRYDTDSNKNGAVSFFEHPILTHPTSAQRHMRVELPGSVSRAKEMAEFVNGEVVKFLENEIGTTTGKGGLSEYFQSDNAAFSHIRFLYTHLAARFRLERKDVAGLGSFWHRLPADSRFPDHSIWQHNALTSAIYSSMSLAGDENEVGMLVFSITPVQGFIAKARKLRDYWTGSVILSWLAFAGLCWTMENLGPDHVLYPSLVDQPLVYEYLRQAYKGWRRWEDALDGKDGLDVAKNINIASFPNKFVLLIPYTKAKEIADAIKETIHKAWMNLNDMTAEKIAGLLGEKAGHVHEMFKTQAEHFWDFDWAAVRLLGSGDKKIIAELLPEMVAKSPLAVADTFSKLYRTDGKGQLYAVTHSLAQAALASGKMQRSTRRPKQTGEKCHLCAEFEVLHVSKDGEWESAKKYKDAIRNFWETLRNHWDGSPFDFNANEKLCAICLTKRMASKVMRENKDHVLSAVLRDGDAFESTTEMALHDFFARENIPLDERHALAQRLHDKSETDDVTRIDGKKLINRDVYYAILMMDGDKMGQLVNGGTIGATWGSIMHPELVTRLGQPGFDKKFADVWKELFNQQRILSSAMHSAISESLGNFAFYGVAPVIKKYHGRLIYAGGDDVCAVMSMSTAFCAATEIREFYISAFRRVAKNNGEITSSSVDGDTWSPRAGYLALGLGKGKDIDISAGILICHHKENLAQMIERAHELLENKAKKDCDRGACAIALRKHSGGSRYFARKWAEVESWSAFEQISGLIGSVGTERISTSLVYRLQKFSDGIDAIVKSGGDTESHLHKFIRRQLDRSLVPEGSLGQLASQMVKIVWRKDKPKEFKHDDLEGLIVAAFLPALPDLNGG